MAVDGAARGRRDGASASRCCAGRGRRCCSAGALRHPGAAGADRAFVGRRLARSGHQQPADPPGRRGAVGRRSAGPAGACAARRASTPTSRPARFSAVALWCFVAMALSGVVNALVRIQLGDLLHSGYGWLVIGKAVALCALGVLGWQQRRRGVAALASRSGGPRPADPAGADRGGGLRPDVRHRRRAGPHPAATAADRQPVDPRGRDRLRLRGSADGGAGAVRLALRPRLRHGGDRASRRCTWPGCAGCAAAATPGRPGRIVAWLCGCAVLLFATSSGIGRYMPAMFSMHMAAHMLLSMLAPVLLVLGAPVTLALAGAARRRARRSARPAGVAAGRVAQPGVAVPHQPDRRDGAVRRRLLRPLLRRHLRRRGGQPRRARRDEPALPADRLPVLLGGHRRRPDAAAHPAAGASWRWCSPRCRCTRSSASC